MNGSVVDGYPYAINFRLRMPTAWNERFYMGGGGGTNGSLVDPTAGSCRKASRRSARTRGIAMRSTTTPTRAAQLRSVSTLRRASTLAHNSYDLVTRAGKAIVAAYYRVEA